MYIFGSGSAQLVEPSPPSLEVRSSNPVIGKKYVEHLLEKTKINKKEAGIGTFFKKSV